MLEAQLEVKGSFCQLFRRYVVQRVWVVSNFAVVDASNCFDNKNAFRCAIVTISRFFHIVLFEQTIIVPFAVEFNA